MFMWILNHKNNNNNNNNMIPQELYCFVCRRLARISCETCHVARYCGRECMEYARSHGHTCGPDGVSMGAGVEDKITDPVMLHRGWGFCLDCVADSNSEPTQISYFCDFCSAPFICNRHEHVHRMCGICRMRLRNAWGGSSEDVIRWWWRQEVQRWCREMMVHDFILNKLTLLYLKSI